MAAASRARDRVHGAAALPPGRWRDAGVGVLTAADFEAARDRFLIGRRDASGALLPEEKQRSIDQEVARLLRQAEETATGLLRGHRDTLDRVIGLLLERETIDGADLAAIVGTPAPADHQPAGAPLALTMRWQGL